MNNYDHYEKYGFGRWSVLHKETQEYLGWCGLKYDEALDEVDLGFRFYQKHWRKGFATEAAKKCIEIGFAQLRLKKIVGRVMPENRASIKVLEKVGMSFVERRIVNDQEWFVYAISS
ncbi:GNAT family N-acetyltransferase [Chryseobacterium suipulveris]|uniref:GNAT family N-acetyltransferase n=1 Tax=Chryseobacterium suipulveris TaxID=2929800 RepID=A0ABY4BTA5_9FLAO|nr:GNAT family N-acetyltransferase [Chryseobacterium suipulveris]UOE42432.1 GNAT family N-acetyltransferase [Chryseobacterium suipulveris]